MALASVEIETGTKAYKEDLALAYENKRQIAKAAHAAYMMDRSMGNKLKLDNALRESALALNALRCS